MPEPSSTTTVASWAAWLSAVTLALLGVDYYALLGAFGGVLFTLAGTEGGGKTRAVSAVVITTFVAAVCGQGVANFAGITARPVVILLSLLFGAGGKPLVQAGIDSLAARLKIKPSGDAS